MVVKGGWEEMVKAGPAEGESEREELVAEWARGGAVLAGWGQGGEGDWVREAAGVGWAVKESASRRWAPRVTGARAVRGAEGRAEALVCGSQQCTRSVARGRGRPLPATWRQTLHGENRGAKCANGRAHKLHVTVISEARLPLAQYAGQAAASLRMCTCSAVHTSMMVHSHAFVVKKALLRQGFMGLHSFTPQ